MVGIDGIGKEPRSVGISDGRSACNDLAGRPSDVSEAFGLGWVPRGSVGEPVTDPSKSGRGTIGGIEDAAKGADPLTESAAGS